MARQHRLPPSASSLTLSMRDLGYSLETAIADLIDNSISADATKVEIFCDLDRDRPTLAVIDNGKGMDSEQLIQAMRHGSASPKEERSSHDLGRFGLGLKTATFSQCKCLTVVSRRDGSISGAEWDLDTVDKEDDWLLDILDDAEISELPFIDKLGDRGTIVIWRKLDRLFEDQSGLKRDEIVHEKLDILDRHLALVFHRFLNGEVKKRKKITIEINGHEVDLFDPFCRKNDATQLLPEEIVRVGGETVRIQPFILPHHSRLTAKEYDYYQDRSDFISNQGAYIYRNGRLMAWGDWFRLVPKGEATKLARVQIDFPNSLDESWTIDIKKSRARPPHAVRERLRQVITTIAGRSTRVHKGRGKKLFEEVEAPVWERYADRGRIRYSLNRSHPLVAKLISDLGDSQNRSLELLLDAISTSLPVEMIYSDFSTHPRDIRQTGEIETESILERLRDLKDVLFDGSKTDVEAFREVVRSVRLFDGHMELAEQFIQKEFS